MRFWSFTFNWQCVKKEQETFENDHIETTKDKYLLVFNPFYFEALHLTDSVWKKEWDTFENDHVETMKDKHLLVFNPFHFWW